MNHMELPFLQTIEQMIDGFLFSTNKYDRYERKEKNNSIVLTRITEDNDVYVYLVPKVEQTIIDLRIAWNNYFLEYGEDDLISQKDFLSDYLWTFKV